MGACRVFEIGGITGLANAHRDWHRSGRRFSGRRVLGCVGASRWSANRGCAIRRDVFVRERLLAFLLSARCGGRGETWPPTGSMSGLFAECRVGSRTIVMSLSLCDGEQCLLALLPPQKGFFRAGYRAGADACQCLAEARAVSDLGAEQACGVLFLKHACIPAERSVSFRGEGPRWKIP